VGLLAFELPPLMLPVLVEFPPLILPPLMFPPLMLPPLILPPPVLLELIFIGVGVLVGVDTFMVLVLFVVEFELFAVSLPQPMPKAATASKVRRAKVLRIELSPVTQRGQIVRELGRSVDTVSAGMLPLQLGQLVEPHEINSPQPRGVPENKHTGQVNYLQPLMSALISIVWRAKFY
jgi:hypothetical protein